MENKFTEQKEFISDPARMLNMYTAEKVVRAWMEKFVDEDTGEEIQVERKEIILEKGTLITNEIISQIKFHLDAGDIKGVLCSNQKRLAYELKRNGLIPMVFLVVVKNKSKTILGYGSDITSGIECLKDFLELSTLEPFGLKSVKFISRVWVADNKFSESTENYNEGIGKIEDYYLTLHLEVGELMSEENIIIFGTDIMDAVNNATGFLYSKLLSQYKNDDEKMALFNSDWEDKKMRIISAKKFKYDLAIPLEFCKAYEQGRQI